MHMTADQVDAAFRLTVIVCTHNPRGDYLLRTMSGLRQQTLPTAVWQLIVIDNGSATAVSEEVVAWHPHGKVEREDQLGLTHARLRGISESASPLLVFVDDDNVLAPTYLADAVRIADEYPFLGAWGGGCRGEFETPPPQWLIPYLSFVAVKECTELLWSNEYFHGGSTPIGAGMCIRKAVADRYLATINHDEVRRLLGRRGSELAGSEDRDMAMTAIDSGLGVGRFPQLQLVHLIPTGRMTESYILRLVEESQASNVVLRAIRGKPHQPYMSGSLLKQTLTWLRVLTLPRMDRQIRLALMRGYKKGQAIAARLSAAE
jgi:glycosyltransferase involved in cell wall biosynthesis